MIPQPTPIYLFIYWVFGTARAIFSGAEMSLCEKYFDSAPKKLLM